MQKIVLKACAFEPKDRYQSAREMREDLQRLSGAAVPVVEPQPVQVPEITKTPELPEEEPPEEELPEEEPPEEEPPPDTGVQILQSAIEL